MDSYISNSRPNWLLRAKVMPQRQAVAVAQRDALVKSFPSPADMPIVMIEAPAGFGKSTLLAQLYEQLVAAGESAAWLTLSKDDVQDTFIAYIAYALEESGIALPPLFWSTVFDERDHSGRAGLSIILNAISYQSKDVVLILDDMENVIDEQTLNLVGHLIRNAPPNMQIIASCRTNPGLLISDLIVRGVIKMVTVDELRLSRIEIAALFENELQPKELNALFDQTEGWPFAVQIAKSSLRRSGAELPPDAIDTWQATGLAGQYIQEHVVASLDEDSKSLLRDLAILEWIHPKAADALRDQTDCLVTTLCRDEIGSFLTFVDDHDQTYRMHPLIREHLSKDLQTNDKERYRRLNRRAAEWMAVNGRFVDALGHARNAEDETFIGELIEAAGGVRLWLLKGTPRLIAVDAFITDDMLKDFPRLALMRAICRGRQACYSEARDIFEAVRERTQDFSRDRLGGSTEALRFDRVITEVTLTVYGCLPFTKELLDRSAQVFQSDENKESRVRAYHHTMLGLAHNQSAQFDEALWHINAGILACKQGKRDYESLIYFDYHCGLVEMARGASSEAARYYHKARQAGRQHFNGDKNLKLIGDVLTMELSFERNETIQVKRLTPNLVKRLHRSESWFDVYAAAYFSVSEYLVEAKGLTHSLAFLDVAENFAAQQSLPTLVSYIDTLRIMLCCANGKLSAAEAYVTTGHLDWLDDKTENVFYRRTWREVEAQALAGFLLADAQGDHQKAIELADFYAEEFDRVGLSRSLIRLSAQLASYYWRRGEQELALQALKRTLKGAKKSGFERAFWLDRGTFEKMLSAALVDQSLWHDEDVNEYAANLRDRLLVSEDNETGSILLSPREWAVVHELVKGGQDKVIARSLDITENTVRFHLKNIFTKVGAASRGEVVAIIRNNGTQI